MKLNVLTLMFLSICFSANAWSKIISHEGKMYLRDSGKQVPLELVNELVKKGEVSEVTLFEGGEVRMLSFARKGQPARIYSVDQKGFVYSIEPFTNYRVKTTKKGLVQFHEEPKRFYKIDPNGIFTY
jgi:hypothetical protein